jgi:Zn finger protein HypA/HybF involved in hydrogenase expression
MELVECTHENNIYSFTVECECCHDLYYGEIQLLTDREVSIVKRLLKMMFVDGGHVDEGCPVCGSKDYRITVSNKYYMPAGEMN